MNDPARGCDYGTGYGTREYVVAWSAPTVYAFWDGEHGHEHSDQAPEQCVQRRECHVAYGGEEWPALLWVCVSVLLCLWIYVFPLDIMCVPVCASCIACILCTTISISMMCMYAVWRNLCVYGYIYDCMHTCICRVRVCVYVCGSWERSTSPVHLYVCMYACMCVCVHVYMYVCIYVSIYVCMYVCAAARLYVGSMGLSYEHVCSVHSMHVKSSVCVCIVHTVYRQQAYIE